MRSQMKARARSEAVGRVCDITNPDQVREMIGQLGRFFGGIDILVNNAGVIQVGPAELMTVADYEEAAGLFLDVTASILAGVNAILPAPGGIGTSRAKESESESAFSPSILTIANEQAAREYNEIAG